MLIKIPVNVSVRCICGAKLDAVIVDDEKFDIAVVVDNEHKCTAAEQPLAPDVCHVCHGKGVVTENGRLRTCVWC